ncbi:MAG: hypothetical protein ABIH49_02190 [archaeon]
MGLKRILAGVGIVLTLYGCAAKQGNVPPYSIQEYAREYSQRRQMIDRLVETGQFDEGAAIGLVCSATSYRRTAFGNVDDRRKEQECLDWFHFGEFNPGNTP